MASNDDLDVDKKHFKIRNKIVIDPEMFYSEIFKGLSASELRTLMRILQKRKWSKIKRNGRKQIVYSDDGFIFPYAEAEFLGIGTTQYWKNIKKLIELGFLDIVHQGGWYQKNEKQKDYSIYKASDRWRDYGTVNFKRVDKPKVLQEDFYIKKNIAKQQTGATSQERSGLLHKCEGDGTKQGEDRLHKSEVGSKQAKPAARLDKAV